ncbi:Ig-like domain-containing protein [Pseudomonas sp. PHC1]|uniref:Ig-like domain-containing protein n=1 Tax=Pseudomonas sp. PHC1 TaxID=3384759 RepID=UPI00396F45AA
MSTQNPFFSFFTTHPGGTPLNNPDITQSEGIEIGADGPPGDPLEITDTHGGTLKVLTPPDSVFNQSGRYLHQELNMLDGMHTFGLRANSSSAPFDQWKLTVSASESEVPILVEVLGDNNDDPTTVDLDKMKGGPLWALVHLVPSIWQGGDRIHLTFEAWLNGAMVATHDETLPIGHVPGQFSWPIPNVKVVANSQVKVKFEHIRAGNVIGVSKTAEAQVVGVSAPELVFDTSPVELPGKHFYVTALSGELPEFYKHPSAPAPKSHVHRKASGGSGIITYRSSNTDVAMVDSEGGVFARANGVATITASDEANQSKSYEVRTTGIAQQLVHVESQTWKIATQIAAAHDGRLLTLQELQDHYPSFTNKSIWVDGATHSVWSSTEGPVGHTRSFWLQYYSGRQYIHLDRPDHFANSIYLIP